MISKPILFGSIPRYNFEFHLDGLEVIVSYKGTKLRSYTQQKFFKMLEDTIPSLLKEVTKRLS